MTDYGIVLIKADGSLSPLDLNCRTLDLQALRELVGGSFEVVTPVPFGCSAFDRVRMVIDEEGALKGKPCNVLASALYNGFDPIDGDVVLVWYDSCPVSDIYALPASVSKPLFRWLNGVREGVLRKYGRLTAE